MGFLPFLSQATHLEILPLSQAAFQEHATHTTEWPVMLSSKGSEGTCIPSGVSTFLHAAFTAHLLSLIVKNTDGYTVHMGTIAKITLCRQGHNSRFPCPYGEPRLPLLAPVGGRERQLHGMANMTADSCWVGTITQSRIII
jgi:hypothetical protein